MVTAVRIQVSRGWCFCSCACEASGLLVSWQGLCEGRRSLSWWSQSCLVAPVGPAEGNESVWVSAERPLLSHRVLGVRWASEVLGTWGWLLSLRWLRARRERWRCWRRRLRLVLALGGGGFLCVHLPVSFPMVFFS